MQFYEIIKVLCDERDLAYEALSSLTNISQNVLKEYKENKKKPNKEDIEKFSAFFGESFTIKFKIFKKERRERTANIISIVIGSIFVILTTIPICKVFCYDYSNGSPPTKTYFISSGLFITLKYHHPIVLITSIVSIFNIVFSALIIKKNKFNTKATICNLIIWIIEIVLMLISILGIINICLHPPVGY